MHQTLVIGDIHGCYTELQDLLDKAGPADGDAIIAIGDIVDRGLETPQVLDFFRNTPNARAIMGNHERKHVRAARHEVKLSISQQISQVQFGPAYPDALAWMAGLPIYADLEPALVVHGYFEPGVPLDQQKPTVLCGTMGGDKVLREGYDRPWYELYDADKPIIVGHANYTKTDQPFIYHDKVFGLDTDCVTGKALTGIWLPAFRLVSVPSRGNHWMQTRRTIKIPKLTPAAPRVTFTWSEAQDRQLDFLFQKLLEVNRGLMARIQNTPGFVELTPREQTRLYAGLVGQGDVSNLLHLARLEKLDLALARKIVHDPGQLEAVIEKVLAISKAA